MRVLEIGYRDAWELPEKQMLFFIILRIQQMEAEKAKMQKHEKHWVDPNEEGAIEFEENEWFEDMDYPEIYYQNKEEN
jgi:hypothetical protein